jgi:hypothetical protein
VTADERLAGARLKIDRARKHAIELEWNVNAFLTTRPYRVVRNAGPPITYEVSDVKPVPGPIGAVFGDAVHNLRSALDHVQRQLVLIALGVDSTDKDTEFLIRNDGSRYKADLAKTRNGGLLRKDSLDALVALECFKGGKGHQIWILNRLDVIDKHRVILAAGGAYRSFNVAGFMARQMKEAIAAENAKRAATGGRPFGLNLQNMTFPDAFLRPADVMCPLKPGDALLIGADGLDVDKDFRFNVALNEPQVMDRKPILDILKELMDAVTAAADALKPCLNA